MRLRATFGGKGSVREETQGEEGERRRVTMEEEKVEEYETFTCLRQRERDGTKRS